MLINPVQAANINTFVNPRVISYSSNPVAGTVIYTVPAGKKFIGNIATSVAATINITPSGGTTYGIGVPGSSTAYLPITLTAGASVGSAQNTYATNLIGIESDL